MTATPDFLQRIGINEQQDNLGAGRLKADANLMAQLFGDDFIHTVNNHPPHEQHTENEK